MKSKNYLFLIIALLVLPFSLKSTAEASAPCTKEVSLVAEIPVCNETYLFEYYVEAPCGPEADWHWRNANHLWDMLMAMPVDCD